jgi:metal-sulfur cluster biosynthetic enzyme
VTLAVHALALLDDAVVEALGTVRDPELDEPVTDLGFVAECEVGGDGHVRLVLRLPTYFCAPNFAYLMVADADDAVRSVPGVTRVDVRLVDHFAAEAINAGVAARAGFASAFEGEAAGELDGLRRDFLVKALIAHTHRVCRPLLAGGRTPADLAALHVRDVDSGYDRDRLRQRRAELGLPDGLDEPLLMDPRSGAGTAVEQAAAALARARLSHVNTEANTGICRGMLARRYESIGIGQREDQDG